MNKEEMPKAYDAKAYEKDLYTTWETGGYFSPDEGEGTPYAIMMPPPNVTGILHLGHALENTLMDTMARYQRMRGKKVLLLPGTDHSAIATQAKVEKMLMEEGMERPREELGREALVERIRAFADESMATILGQIRTLGTSCDWDRLAYTFDDARNKAVNELFTRMYNDGLIYRGYRVVNWSVKGQSTQSDDEIEHVERASKLYTFKYSKDFPITIATTRPETKVGDTAVAVHPTDERYKQYIGQTFTVDVGAAAPLNIRVIADEEVDPSFGTGALGVTPAHSSTDFLMYEKQKAEGTPIEIIPVIGTDGRMTEAAGRYAGQTVEEARENFVLWLKEEGLLEKEEEITQSVGVSDRYGDVIEALPLTQWWLDVNREIPGRGKTLRQLMREAVTTGIGGDASKKTTVTPDRFTKLYLDRVDSLRDWCLSRQIWWGHRIPVWYKGEEVFVGTSAPEGDGWEQDPDTLDTWFSSGSWTFSTLGWPDQTEDLATFHPTAWMQMGYEILYLWLMRMILMSAYLFDDVPFAQAYIHGMLRDKEGKKFSKSAGNGIDPIEVIQEYGADALRVSLLIGITPGNDSRYYTEKIESGRNFVNKLWNISRFVLSSIESVDHPVHPDALSPQTTADHWILSRFQEVSERVTGHLESYEFSAAGELLRDFTWSEFADWYVEIAKAQRRAGLAQSTDAILLFVLERLITYWHPIMPFVTEQIWSHIDGEELLIKHEWPLSQLETHEEATQDMGRLQEVIGAIRNVRNQYNIEPAKRIPVLIDAPADDAIMREAAVIKSLARISELTIKQGIEKPEESAAIVVAGVTVYLPLSGVVDLEKERARVREAIIEKEAYLARIQAKLANETFVSQAPEAVVEGVRTTEQETRAALEALKTQQEQLA